MNSIKRRNQCRRENDSNTIATKRNVSIAWNHELKNVTRTI